MAAAIDESKHNPESAHALSSNDVAALSTERLVELRKGLGERDSLLPQIDTELHRRDVLIAVSLSAGAPIIGTPTLVQRHNLTALPLTPGSKSPASSEAIRHALRLFFFRFVDGSAPDMNKTVKPVNEILATFGLKATKVRIQDIIDEDEFEPKRPKVGKHRT
jgi:hypothetical protein